MIENAFATSPRSAISRGVLASKAKSKKQISDSLSFPRFRQKRIPGLRQLLVWRTEKQNRKTNFRFTLLPQVQPKADPRFGPAISRRSPEAYSPLKLGGEESLTLISYWARRSPERSWEERCFEPWDSTDLEGAMNPKFPFSGEERSPEPWDRSSELCDTSELWGVLGILSFP